MKGQSRGLFKRSKIFSGTPQRTARGFSQDRRSGDLEYKCYSTDVRGIVNVYSCTWRFAVCVCLCAKSVILRCNLKQRRYSYVILQKDLLFLFKRRNVG